MKWERESVGLAVAVPQRQIVSQTDDKTSYLFQLTPDARGRIDYAFEMIWRKSEWLKDRSDTECVLGLMESVGRPGPRSSFRGSDSFEKKCIVCVKNPCPISGGSVLLYT
ncbi:MAG: DUF4861 family protein [Alistipes shahii]